MQLESTEIMNLKVVLDTEQCGVSCKLRMRSLNLPLFIQFIKFCANKQIQTKFYCTKIYYFQYFKTLYYVKLYCMLCALIVNQINTSKQTLRIFQTMTSPAQFGSVELSTKPRCLLLFQQKLLPNSLGILLFCILDPTPTNSPAHDACSQLGPHSEIDSADKTFAVGFARFWRIFGSGSQGFEVVLLNIQENSQ